MATLSISATWVRAMLLGVLLTLTFLQTGEAQELTVQASSPAANSTVGGHIDLLDVQFSGEIVNPGLLLTGPDAGEIAGLLTQPAPDRLYYRLEEPIAADGPYWVDYAVVSPEGREIISRFGFNYREAAPAPIALYERPRFSDLQLATIGILFGLLLVGAWYAVTHRAKGPTHR